MTTWFIADTHFGRQPRQRLKVLGLTGGELDERIASRWRELVGDDDEIWHLGDIGPDMDRIAGLPGIKHLIRGNDDPPLKFFDKNPLFRSARSKHTLQADGTELFLVHRPADIPGTASGIIVHGHTHHLDPAPGHRSVSVDRTDWGPITLDQLVRMAA